MGRAPAEDEGSLALVHSTLWQALGGRCWCVAGALLVRCWCVAGGLVRWWCVGGALLVGWWVGGLVRCCFDRTGVQQQEEGELQQRVQV